MLYLVCWDRYLDERKVFEIDGVFPFGSAFKLLNVVCGFQRQYDVFKPKLKTIRKYKILKPLIKKDNYYYYGNFVKRGGLSETLLSRKRRG